MASLQSDLAEQIFDPSVSVGGIGDSTGAACIKLNRRSLGGLAFEVQFEEAAASAPSAIAGSSAGTTGSAGSPTRKAEEIAEQIAKRLAEAEQRREQQLAQRVGKIETRLVQVSEAADRRKREEEELAESIVKAAEAAEERRLGRMEEVKQRARGNSAKDRRELVREQQEAAKVVLEAELEKDIKEKEARRKEQLEKIVQGAQNHLAKVEEVRAQRVQSGASEAN